MHVLHLVTKEGIKPHPKNIKAVTEFPEPKNAKEVKLFLEFSGYYRRFINNNAKIARPLTRLLQKDVPFQ